MTGVQTCALPIFRAGPHREIAATGNSIHSSTICNPEQLTHPQSKTPSISWAFLNLIGQLPTLPHTRACSTIGAERLNFRVRDGNGWDPLATVTQNRSRFLTGLNIDGHPISWTAHNGYRLCAIPLVFALVPLCIHSKILWSSRTGY